jgi:hypothetical protein
MCCIYVGIFAKTSNGMGSWRNGGLLKCLKIRIYSTMHFFWLPIFPDAIKFSLEETVTEVNRVKLGKCLS